MKKSFYNYSKLTGSEFVSPDDAFSNLYYSVVDNPEYYNHVNNAIVVYGELSPEFDAEYYQVVLEEPLIRQAATRSIHSSTN